MKTSIEKRISEDYIAAFKNRETEKKLLLNTLLGEMGTHRKNLKVEELSDAGSVKILTKFTKAMRETLEVRADEKTARELEILEQYMPKMMSESEVIAKIEELKSGGMTQMGEFMKAFGELPADKKMISGLLKTML